EALKNGLSTSKEKTTPIVSNEGVAPSLLNGEVLECEACGYQVPSARFCCECAAPLPQDRSAQFPAPFTGRSEELSWLESRRPNAAQIAGARLAGEHGSGKSRLLEEFAQIVSAQGDQVILVEADPYNARVRHHAVGEAVRILARLTSEMIENNSYERASSEV